jgi:sensor histidine kinase regulating citrate/malate metabolism
MYFRRAYGLYRDTHAVLGQPIRLFVVIIIVAAIVGMCTISFQQLILNTQIHQVEYEISRVMTEASNMFEYADEGTSITLHIELPPSLHYIVFGSLPTNSTTEPLVLALNENTSNNYYFVMNDGTIRLYHSNSRFSNQNFTQIVLLYSGVYNITLELCSHEGKTYVTIF